MRATAVICGAGSLPGDLLRLSPSSDPPAGRVPVHVPRRDARHAAPTVRHRVRTARQAHVEARTWQRIELP